MSASLELRRVYEERATPKCLTDMVDTIIGPIQQ